MNITTEATQHPNILKFLYPEPFFKGSKEYNKESDTSDFPLATVLLQFPFVDKVLAMDNMIAIEKTDTVDWEIVQEALEEVIKEGINEYVQLKNKFNKVPVTIYAEMTPNPEVMKFVANTLLYDRIAEAKDSTEIENFPLAKKMFEYKYVKEIFVSENYISITKKKDFIWEEITLEIRNNLSQYLQEGNEVVTENFTEKKHKQQTEAKLINQFSDIEKEISALLEEYVKPAVAGDGGNIELISFDSETKTAKMLLQGACSGCPSSTMTLKSGIESMLKEMLPGKVENVEAING